MNTNFFSKTSTLPRNKLLPHTYCHRSEQQSKSAAHFQSSYKHEGNFIYNFENATSVLLLLLHYSGQGFSTRDLYKEKDVFLFIQASQ